MKQISVVAENRQGMLQAITAVMARGNINIFGFVTIDAGEYGVMRLIVSDTDKALSLLKEAGYLCQTREVIGVEMDDKVGSLSKLLDELKNSYINIDYIYLTFGRKSAKPVFVINVDDRDAVENCLRNKGFTVIEEVD